MTLLVVVARVSIRCNVEVLVSRFAKLAGTYPEIRKKLTKIEYFARTTNESLYLVSSIRTL